MEDPSGNLKVRRAAPLALVGLVALVSAGCMNPVGTTAASALRKVREASDPNVRHLAYEALASPNRYESEAQKVEAANELAAHLDDADEPVASRAVICRTLGRLRRPEGRAAVLRAVDSPDELVRGEACRALGQVGRPEDSTVLARIMAADVSIDCRVAAIEGLGSLKAGDPRIAAALVDNMEHPDPAIRLASVDALRSLSGRDLGVDVGPWKQYANELVKATPAAPAADGSPAPGPAVTAPAPTATASQPATAIPR